MEIISNVGIYKVSDSRLKNIVYDFELLKKTKEKYGTDNITELDF